MQTMRKRHHWILFGSVVHSFLPSFIPSLLHSFIPSVLHSSISSFLRKFHHRHWHRHRPCHRRHSSDCAPFITAFSCVFIVFSFPFPAFFPAMLTCNFLMCVGMYTAFMRVCMPTRRHAFACLHAGTYVLTRHVRFVSYSKNRLHA